MKTTTTTKADNATAGEPKKTRPTRDTSPFNSALNDSIRIDRDMDFNAHMKAWAFMNSLSKKK